MGFKKIVCSDCGRRIIIDSRELDQDDELIVCPYCGEPIELPRY